MPMISGEQAGEGAGKQAGGQAGMRYAEGDARIVAALRAAGCVYAEDEARLLTAAVRTPTELAELVRRRAAGLPLEHVLGWVEFAGRRLVVEPGVFVPRHRTEALARQAAALLPPTARPGAAPGGRATVVVDLCCGVGAVGAVLATAPDTAPGAKASPVELHAVDVDPAAVRCARTNLAELGGRVYQGDLYDALPAALRGRVDVLVANAPYVPTEEIALLPPEAREHEPRVALDGGLDGLDVLRRVVAGAAAWLAPGGRLLVEASDRQAPRLAECAAGAGLVVEVVRWEELEATVLVARLRPTGSRVVAAE